MCIIMFELSILNHPEMNDLANFCISVLPDLSISIVIGGLCLEKVYSIASYSTPFYLIMITSFISAIAMSMIKNKGYDYLKGALVSKSKRKEILEQELDPNDNPNRRVVDIGWATLIRQQGELERVIFDNNDRRSSWLLEVYKSKGVNFNLNGITRTGMFIKIGDDEQADKEIGIYIDGQIKTSYLSKYEGGIWTIRPPIRNYFEDSAPRDMVHPRARLLSEGRPIIFDRDFKKMFVRGHEKNAYILKK